MADLEKLEKLDRLRKSGALSQEEFERQKQVLLEARPVNWIPWAAGALVVVVLLAVAVILLTRQIGGDISNTVASSTRSAPLAGATDVSILPVPTPSPSPARVDPPVPASAAPDPTNADYYNDAKRAMMRRYPDQPPGIRAMLGDWAGANTLCRGSNDPATTAKWCPVRDAIDAKLLGQGMCYGRATDQSASQSDWHTCDDQDDKQQ